MKRVKQIYYPNIGVVNYAHKTRAKRITLRVKSDSSVHVTIPFLISFSKVEEFVLSKEKWIIRKQQENKEFSINSTLTSFNTRYHKLLLEPKDDIVNRVYTEMGNGVIKMFYPSHLDPSSPKIQEAFKKVIVETLRMEAAQFLPTRLYLNAQQHEFNYSGVSIRNSKTRWGSCSGKNRISLSLYLMLLPNHLIDYVLLHELCHTKEKNHGQGFWNLLNLHCNGKARELAQNLKKYRIPF